jgi:glutathione synthase/RimK-type ligase-like ATP-grasp enzyme
MKSILVTGAGGSAGHNVCWSLRVSKDGRSLTLTGCDVDRTSLELNMWLDHSFHIPSAHERGYVTALNKAVENGKVELVIPQPDPEVERVSAERARVRARIFLPDPSTVTTCLDKFDALSRWHDAGLRTEPVPISQDDPANMQKIRQLEYPCWIRAREGAGGLMSCKATSATTAEHWVKFHWDQGIKTNFVAEEYLPGRDYCFMSLWNGGGLVTSMVRERLSWVGHRVVGSGGTSKLNRVVHSEAVNNKALEAIRAVSKKPHGIFCVDLKENTKGLPNPTEINCRFTTNVHYLSLASIKLGHPEWNFPWIAAKLALEEDIPDCAKTNALPSDLWFTKNTDMGFTMTQGNHWKASEVF